MDLGVVTMSAEFAVSTMPKYLRPFAKSVSARFFVFPKGFIDSISFYLCRWQFDSELDHGLL
ncbi:hypothetical protein HMPREF1640_04940 [Prevotella sp. S7-1-8]|nr:hypothetical protein HMPREF1640_04940 [Prevotella sp. S7-1-8]